MEGDSQKRLSDNYEPPGKGEIFSKEFSIDESSYDYANDTSIAPRTKKNIFVRAFDSFREPEDVKDYSHLSKQDKALIFLSRTTPKLSRRHLMVIAASSCVGTGLFIGSGSSLKLGGPAALLIGFGLMSISLVCIMSTIGEISVRYPTLSPFYELPSRFLDPSLGFAIGWIYAFCWMVTIPLELIAGATLTQFWRHDNNSAAKVNPVAWVALLWAFDAAINLAGSRVYGELEFVVGAIKITAVFGWILFSLINVCGGPPTNHYLGGYNFTHPKAFTHSFKGVIQVLVSCAFAFGGTEVSGIAAAETANPIKAIPSAVKQVFWRVLVFFIISVLFVGLMVPSDTEGLGNSDSGAGSPFVLALSLTGVKALPSIFNAVIICSVIGVSNAAIYASSRTLTAMAVKGAAPPFLCYIDRQGRPLYSLLVVIAFSLLCFVCASTEYNTVFNWLYAFAALAFLFAWSAVCVVYVRIRHAFKVRDRSLDELVYRSPVGIPGAIIGGGIPFAVLCLQFWIYLFPIGGKPDASYFFQGDLSIPVFIGLFIGHKIVYWKSSRWVRTSEIDIDSGVREIDLDRLREMQEEERRNASKNPFKRLGRILC
ncbi:Agp2 protein [Starmerella bacillaris]|uniref:Agp2 protein n=1 Tax=Starmerella bacillaris TaxID=1247836 RepID=A0AAV5REE2_STABA|nr:Agp2 protein [Starmerella bacillaris]